MRALLRKETLQILRDRATLGMLLGIPLLQIIIFGFAIELTPHTLSVSLVADKSSSLVNSPLGNLIGPASIVREPTVPVAKQSLARGSTNLIIDASHHPPTVYVDASNPIEATVSELRIEQSLRAIEAPLDPQDDPPAAIRVERLYNPHVKTQPYLLTGLLGAIPTMSLVMMSALTLARERERKTIQVLRASPARFFETACGKLLPYLILGLIQCLLIITVMRFMRRAEFNGSGLLLSGPTVMFALANLAVGFLFSCLARQQLQAAQLTFFFFLPSSLLSGFMFPFKAMPFWAQRVGEVFPMTHYLRITRGVMLKGVDAGFVWAETLPILAFTSVAMLGAYSAWRREGRS
ncbi:MAG TPA: ABC transporter permease [Steroidobacteraceae bacterium]|nr:ABC transporter permease [Steroidobacteraceae bacterium]